MTREQNPILYRIDASLRLICGGSRDPITTFGIIPVLFVCQRKYMNRFEASPVTKASKSCWPASYNASLVSLTYSMTE